MARTLIFVLSLSLSSVSADDFSFDNARLLNSSALVSVFDKDVPETGHDLLTLQQSAMEIAERVRPATVGIELKAKSRREPGAMGSGVVINKSGLVLTAAHVVSEPGRRVVVLFPDGRRVRGRSLGLHTTADGALIQIEEPGDWPVVPMITKAQAPKVGDWCIATGHPRGFQEDRSPPVRVGRVIDIRPRVLRTDCPITGGDSGGPLFDMQGRVIGIHSRITESITENYHVPALAFLEAWDTMKAGEIYPKTKHSQFLALLDTDKDGQLTRQELTTDYERRVFDRLLASFGLSGADKLSIDYIAKEKFKWKGNGPRLDQVSGFDLGSVSLVSRNFVRGAAVRRTFAQGMQHAQDITVRVYGDGDRVALGMVVGQNGLIVTKASQIKQYEQLACLLPDGKKLPAKVLGIEDAYDLAVLQVDATGLAEPQWSDNDIAVGQWAVVPTTSGRVESVGVVSVAPRRIVRSRVVLGVMLNQNIINEALVEHVSERSGAANAGMKVGDSIISIQDESVNCFNDIKDMLESARPGDSVRVKVIRDGDLVELAVLLGTVEDTMAGIDSWRMSGPLSKRRDGFRSVFQIDATLKPEACGGPLVDTNGRVLGVTLARADRVATYALDRETLQPILDKYVRESVQVATGKQDKTN